MEKEPKTYEWPTMPLAQFGDSIGHNWHVAINRFSDGKAGSDAFPKFMYEAKDAAQEVPRLALLFKHEREGKLDKVFQPCSCCTEKRHVVDNHLACCLGTECRKCPFLAALDKAEMPVEQRDWIKAWTCVSHVLMEGGDTMNEGFILTVDDRMYWDRLHESLASSAQPEGQQ